MRSLTFDQLAARGVHAAITIFLYDATLRLTTADQDVVLGGNTFSAAPGVNLTQMQFSSDGTPSGADLRLFPDGVSIKAGWGARGMFDGMPITIDLFSTSDPAAGGYDMIPGAIIGSASEDSNGQITLAVQGKLALLKGQATRLNTTTCGTLFGSDICKKPLDVPLVRRNTAYLTQASPVWLYTRQVFARVFQGGSYNDLVYECTTAGTTHPTVQPTYPTVAGDTVTDGSCVFTARAALLVAATGVAVDEFNIQLTATPDPLPLPLGKIIPQDGPLNGLKIPYRAFDSGTNIVTLFERYAVSNFPSGTSFLIHPGCNRLATTCRDTYANLDNFDGIPYAPAADILTGRA